MFFHLALSGGLLAGAVAVSAFTRRQASSLAVGQAGAFAIAAWLVPELVWVMVESLPATCAGRIDGPAFSLFESGFFVGTMVVSALLGTAALKRRTRWQTFAGLAGSMLFGFVGMLSLFSTIDNGVVEPLFYSC